MTGSPFAKEEVMAMAPILRRTNVTTCMLFYYHNTVAFSLSFPLNLLLVSLDLHKLAKTRVLKVIMALEVMALLVPWVIGSSFGMVNLMVYANLMLVVPVALVIISPHFRGKG